MSDVDETTTAVLDAPARDALGELLALDQATAAARTRVDAAETEASRLARRVAELDAARGAAELDAARSGQTSIPGDVADELDAARRAWRAAAGMVEAHRRAATEAEHAVHRYLFTAVPELAAELDVEAERLIADEAELEATKLDRTLRDVQAATAVLAQRRGWIQGIWRRILAAALGGDRGYWQKAMGAATGLDGATAPNWDPATCRPLETPDDPGAYVRRPDWRPDATYAPWLDAILLEAGDQRRVLRGTGSIDPRDVVVAEANSRARAAERVDEVRATIGPAPGFQTERSSAQASVTPPPSKAARDALGRWRGRRSPE